MKRVTWNKEAWPGNVGTVLGVVVLWLAGYSGEVIGLYFAGCIIGSMRINYH